MKLVLTTIIFVLLAGVAQAEWRHLGGNVYTDGVYEYEATFNKWRCKWEYRKLRPVAPDANDSQFDQKALGFLERLGTQRRNEGILNKFASLLGTDGIQQGGFRSFSRNSYTQGSFFGGGNSIIGQNAAYSVPVLNPTPLIQELTRLQERQDSVRPQVIAGIKDSVDRYTDAATVAAATDSYARGFASAVQAARQNRTEVTETWTEPAGGGNVQAFGSPHDPDAEILDMLWAKQIGTCSACHNATKRAGGKDFAAIDLASAWPEMRRRALLPDGDAQKMPPKGRVSQTFIQLGDAKYGVPQVSE